LRREISERILVHRKASVIERLKKLHEGFRPVAVVTMFLELAIGGGPVATSQGFPILVKQKRLLMLVGISGFAVL
jgi:hypothetical protein